MAQNLLDVNEQSVSTLYQIFSYFSRPKALVDLKQQGYAPCTHHYFPLMEINIGNEAMVAQEVVVLFGNRRVANLSPSSS